MRKMFLAFAAASLFGMVAMASPEGMKGTEVGSLGQQLPRMLVITVQKDKTGKEYNATITPLNFNQVISSDQLAQQANALLDPSQAILVEQRAETSTLPQSMQQFTLLISQIAPLPSLSKSWLSSWVHNALNRDHNYWTYGYGSRPFYGHYSDPYDANYGLFYNNYYYPYYSADYSYASAPNVYYYYYNPYVGW